MSYDKHIDKKWQDRWEEAGIFHAKDEMGEKYYVLVEFPYPSGAGLHVGHPRSYTALDVIARKKRMEGKNVLFPMGWDAFGLPAENYAIKTGIHPSIVTKTNIDNFRRQLKSIGFSFDWSREINTTDPAYYKWTQWMFLQFYKAGLAYKAKMNINWCPKCKIGLANEEVVGGNCERCGTPVEKREKEQWMIAITKYADRLLDDLKTVDYLPKIKKQQEDWIGRSEGAEIDFVVAGGPTVTVFTTRPDTIFGATYLVLAPEHPLVGELTTQEHRSQVEEYVQSTKQKTDIERGDDTKEKTGVFTGAYAINPASGQKIPVWVADYVLLGYGTGAIMAVPGHDERDLAFAKKYQLLIKEVIIPSTFDATNPPREGKVNTFRNTVLVIVRDPDTSKYLCLKWKKQPWTTFITGGIEEGEEAVEAAKREIAEETGYTDVRLVRPLGTIESHFFAAHKGVNRRAHGRIMLFDLVSSVQNERTQEEQDKYDLLWLTASEVVDAKLQHGDFSTFWPRLQDDYFIFTDHGVLIDSQEFSLMSSEEAIPKILEKIGGRKQVKYKLRDWVFSRQRYWGEPIPLIDCAKCGWVTVPEADLPVELPQVDKYEPTDTGESPLATITDWVNTKCPQCGGEARRETDTMPNWAGSSWYFLRYADPNNDLHFADKTKLAQWMPVDVYNGGMEHTTLHLLYSRFWNKFLFDQGLIPTSEPYARRHSHGLIMAEDGTKMSKSKGNVVNPDDAVGEFGADTFRVYMLFMGPFEEPVPWSTKGLIGVKRFLDKVVRLGEKINDSEPVKTTRALHKTIKKVTDDIEGFRFNTAVAALMIFVNTAQESGVSRESFTTFLNLLTPFAPHLANELFEKLGGVGFAEAQAWPVASASLLVDEQVTLTIQVNGKVRGAIEIAADASEADIIAAARSEANVAKYLVSEPQKTIVVPGRVVNFVL